MTLSKNYSTLATVNAFLCLLGYEFFINLTATASSSGLWIQLMNRIYYPILFVSAMFNIIVNIRRSFLVPRSVKLWGIIWIFALIRILTDIYFFGRGAGVDNIYHSSTILMIFDFLSVISLVYSYELINVKSLSKAIFVAVYVLVLWLFFSNPSLRIQAEDRILGGNTNSIALGHIGLTGIIISLYVYFRISKKIIIRLLSIFLSVISFVVMIRAGSRGPLFSGFVVLSFVVLSGQKNVIKGIFYFVSIIFISFLLLNYFVELIQHISPILYDRLFGRIAEGVDYDDFSSGRVNISLIALHLFYESPLWGSSFFLPILGTYTYSHNIFTDFLMEFGIFGFIPLLIVLIKVFRNSFLLIHLHLQFDWIALLFVQRFMFLMTSGSWAADHIFNTSLVLILLLTPKVYGGRLLNNNIR